MSTSSDYNIEGQYNTEAKSEAVYIFVRDMVARGVPIHGVGLQMHVQTNWYPSAAVLGNLLDRYAAIGIDVHITELDIKMMESGTLGKSFAISAAFSETRS